MIPILSSLAKKSPYPEEIQSSRQFQEDSRIDVILEFRVENHVLGQKLSEKVPYTLKLAKNWPFPGDIQSSRKFLEVSKMKFWNSELKIKFLDINWVGLIPTCWNQSKTSQFQGTSGILESWIPGSRNHNISSDVRKINTNMLCRLVF